VAIQKTDKGATRAQNDSRGDLKLQTQEPSPAPHDSKDDRMTKSSWISTLLRKPEFASVAGAMFVFAVFGVFAHDSGMFAADGIVNWSQVSAYLGILAVGACLLMIAGEFDLSLGSMIGFAGMLMAIPAVYYGVPLWASILLAFAGSMALGALNGWIVVRTKLPSFIVTLAFLFILRGLTLMLSVGIANRTVVSGVGDLVEKDWLAQTLFAGTTFKWLMSFLSSVHIVGILPNGTPMVTGIPKVIIWWIVLAVAGAWVLVKTHFGNWIFSVGGDANAARNMGVPVKFVKISLFVLTSFCGCLFAVLQVCDIGSASADRGLQKEFEAIIAAVIGGCLLTGGYGSVIGACFGALIFGVVQMGITYTGAPPEMFRVFLGAMLLTAVLFNNFIRSKVAQSK
jgi:simple sugar transport system permease protein